MNKKAFDKFVKTYEEGLKKGIRSKDVHGKPIEEQSSFVYFDKKTVEKFLETVDDSGGIRIYFGQYDEETVTSLPPSIKEPSAYIGRLSVAMVSDHSYDKNSIKSSTDDEETYLNGGELCPPKCK
jgi:hypothetical protein